MFMPQNQGIIPYIAPAAVDLPHKLWYFYIMPSDRNAVIKEAQKLAAKGQYDKAIAEWRKLLKDYPKEANIYNTIGDLSLKKNAKDDAVDAYKRAADILAADGFSSKAIALYKKILNIDPKKVEVHLALADLNAEKGLVANALESYKIAADHYVQKSDMANALGIYQKMADLNPSNAVFRVKLAEMYAKEGLKKEAAKAFLEAADVHLSKEAFQEARQLFERILTLDPDNKEVYFKAGVVYHKEAKFAEACKALKPAFEADPRNKEIIDLYIDALSQAGRGHEAEEVLKKALSHDETRLDLREKLYHIFLSKKDFDNALAEAVRLVDGYVNERDYDKAESLLKDLVSHATDNIAALRKLAEFYSNVSKKEEAAKAHVRVADICLFRGEREEAKSELSKAMEIFPGLSEAKDMLDRLESTSVAPLEAAPEIEAPPEPAEAPALEGPSFEPAAFEPPKPEPAVEEDPAILEAFTEIDVLIKYGLAAKALEQLEGLISRYPQSIQVRTRLKDLYKEQGNFEKEVEHIIALADIYAGQGMDDMKEAVLREGLEIAPNHSEILSRLGMQPAQQEAPPAVQGPASLEETLSLEEVPGASDLEMPVEEAAGPPAQLIEEMPLQETASVEPLATADISEIWAEAEFYYREGIFDEARKRYEEILSLAPDNKQARVRLDELSREKEAVQEFSKLAEAVEGLEGLVPSDTAEPAGLAESTSDEEAVRTLMEEIKQLEKEKKGRETLRKETTPSPFEQPVAAEPSAPPAAHEDFFDLGSELRSEGPPSAEKTESEDFFDLAAELREELGDVSLKQRPSPALEEQTLDDIFEEFKKGVEVQAGREDSDTHYNLGIAYKEMGLLDDAISEFLLTREGEPMFIESRHMLGLCYMEQGEYLKAATEIRNALSFMESLGGEQRQKVEMLYDLGLAFRGAGNTSEALNAYQQAYDLDPEYRDVASKLRELRQGDFISLEQLKEEIEKEISTKFLEEGERIEREEKIRRNEKVRS